MYVRAIHQNRFFVEAKQAQRLPSLFVAVVVSLLFLFGSSGFGAVLMTGIFLLLDGSIVADTPTMGAVRQDIMLISAFAPIIVLVWLWVRLYEKRPSGTIGLSPHKLLPRYTIGFLIGLALVIFAIVIIFISGELQINPVSPGLTGLAALAGVLLALPGWVVQGAAEEVLIRGWLMSTIGARYKPFFGLFISSLIFTAYHSLNPNFSLMAIFNLFLFGLLTGLYVLKEGSLWGVMGLHAAWNWAEGNLFGFPVSGLGFSSGSLVYLKEINPSFINGGGFGPEGGIAVTLALLVGLIIIGYTLFKSSIQTQNTPEPPV